MEIFGQHPAIENPRLDGQAHDKITWWQMRAQQTELIANDTFDFVTVNRSFEQFFTNYQTKSCFGKTFSSRLIMKHQQFAANRFPETKNG